MRTEWKNSPLAKVALVAAILVTLLSFLFRSKSASDGADEKFSHKIAASVAYVAAESAAKVLGEQEGGRVALILPSYGDEKQFRGSVAEVYESGFKKSAAKFSKMQLLGHWAPKPDTANSFKLAMLEGARAKYMDADLMVVFWSLPNLGPEEERQWLASSPPKLIVIENRPWNNTYPRWFQTGLVQRVFLFNEKVEVQKEKPADPHDIVSLYYTALSAPQ